MGVNLASRQRGSCGSAERLCKSTFQYNANKFPLTYISETDNNSRENIVELRASRAILSGCPGCGYVHSSSKSPGKVTHIIGGSGWFLSGISCLNNTAIVIFASLWALSFWSRVKLFQGFQNQFFMSFTAFRENCYGGPVHFSMTQMFKILWKPRGKT